MEAARSSHRYLLLPKRAIAYRNLFPFIDTFPPRFPSIPFADGLVPLDGHRDLSPRRYRWEARRKGPGASVHVHFARSKGASAHTWSVSFGVSNLQERAEGVEDARNARRRNAAKEGDPRRNGGADRRRVAGQWLSHVELETWKRSDGAACGRRSEPRNARSRRG